MYIAANLPEDFGPLEAIKRANFPFNKKLIDFIESIAKLQERTGLTVPETLGYIENQLIFVGRTPNKTGVRKRVSFRIKTDNVKVQNLYARSDMKHKYFTIELCRLLIALSEVYNTSINNMCYMISSLGPVQTAHEYVNVHDINYQPVQQPIMPHQIMQPVAQYQPIQEPVVHMPQPVTQPVQPTVAQPTTVTEPKKVKPRIKTKPPVDVDDLAARAEKLSQGLKETVTDPGTKVTTNRLLDDFL